MMWVSSFLLLVAFSGVLGQFEDMGEELQQCAFPIQEIDFEELEKESGQVQMDTACPAILQAFQCVDRVFATEFESSLEEIADLVVDMVEEDVSKALRVAVNTKSMLTDLCTEGTELNRDVKKDMECFESIDEDEVAEDCKGKAEIYGVFTDISNEIEEEDPEFDPNAVCQETAFMMACLSHTVHERCGLRAFNTFNTIVKRTTIFPNMICSREKLEEMKTEVIDKLDMPEAEKNLFKLALDLKRRRRK